MLRAAPLLLALLVLGCQRKAPGPEECRGLAQRLFGVETSPELQDPRIRAKFDEQIRDCLVTPYDHALVRCLESGARPRLCEREFTERRLNADDHYQPRLR